MDIMEQVLEDIGATEAGWETDGYGIDALLVCPHGNTVEQDGYSGECGCISPLRAAGLI